MYDLVRAKTEDKLILNGLYTDGDKNKPAIIHLHGFQGTFYTNKFVNKISEKLKEDDFGFIAVQTRGTDIASEIYADNDQGWALGGSDYELLEEAHFDITAWISFLLDKVYKEVILEGHSLGTYKIVRYLFEGDYSNKVKKLIFLAPFDLMQLLEDFTKGKWKEYLKIAEEKTQQGKGMDMIPDYFLDVRMSYQTYVSHHKQNDFQKMFLFHDKNYDFPILNKIKIPVKILVGTGDPYFHPANPQNPDEAMQILLRNIKNSEGKLIKGAKHVYEGYENVVADEVLEFVK